MRKIPDDRKCCTDNRYPSEIKRTIGLASCIFLSILFAAAPSPAAVEGYYRDPAIRGDTLVFAAKGDLWRVDSRGGIAQRLTTLAGGEGRPALSPDGSTLAFRATYEGPTEVYTMPIDGGLPTRRTWEVEPSFVVGWRDENRLVYSTRHYSTLPDPQLLELNLDTDIQNFPHATFEGNDAQLEATVEYLLQEIARDPREVPEAPPYPDKSFQYE